MTIVSGSYSSQKSVEKNYFYFQNLFKSGQNLFKVFKNQ